MRPGWIELHIEELVLHGFAPGDRHPIGDAVEHELIRLFAEQGLPSLLNGEPRKGARRRRRLSAFAGITGAGGGRADRTRGL